jgi:tRNA threonylcarbamoyladenosine biosynthesis protein TsaB
VEEQVLAIDTAGPVVGVALVRGRRVEGSWSRRVSRGAEREIVPAIQRLVNPTRPPEAIALSIGPGAFTSLRVGVATCLGLALAWRCPVVPVSSLKIRAALVPSAARVLVLLDARKDSLFAGLFDTRGLEPEPLGPELEVGVLDFSPFLEDFGPAGETGVRLSVIGEGVLRVQECLEQVGCDLRPEPDESPVLPLARAGMRAFLAGKALPADQIGTTYLRDVRDTIALTS